MTLHYITLRYIALHYITLHYITLHYIALHCVTTLHYITLHYIALHCIALHCISFLFSAILQMSGNPSKIRFRFEFVGPFPSHSSPSITSAMARKAQTSDNFGMSSHVAPSMMPGASCTAKIGGSFRTLKCRYWIWIICKAIFCGDIPLYSPYKGISLWRRKFRSQTSDHMERWKAEMGRVREDKRREEKRREEERRKKIKKEKVSEERRSGARKGRKVAKHCVFSRICGSSGSTSRLAKAAGVEPAGQMRWWKSECRCRAKHMSNSKCNKAHQVRTTFGSCDVEKVHAVVARSTFRGQNVKHTTCSDHFWTFRCGTKEAPTD